MVDTATDSLVLIELDFDVSLPCEHLNHRDDAPASWVAEGMCPNCKVALKILTCDPCKARASGCTTSQHTSGCGAVTMRERWNFIWTPIEEV